MTNKIFGIEITNPNKIIYKNLNITKLDIAKYYSKVSEKMLPYVEFRPLSAVRCHSGIDGECFFKKHPTTEKEMVKTFLKDGEEYFYITTAKEIVFQAQMGTVEFHTNGASVKKLEKPNIMVFDLDPDEKLSLDKLREGVACLKEVLDDVGLESFLKTSGGKGYHIVVPFKSSKGWNMFSTFAENVALLAKNKYPKMFTTNIRKVNRKGKIFIDYLRNDRSSTCVAPYSLRIRETAGISFPISWKDLFKISPSEITIKNYVNYLNKADPWKHFFEVEQKLY